MSVELRRTKKGTFLVGDIKYQITVSKILSNGQVLSVLLYNIRYINY